MDKRAINTNIKREFKESKSRFLSIVALIFLGVFVFIGLKVTGDDIRTTSLDYYKKYNLADSIVVSNYGLTKADREEIENLSYIKKAEFGYSADLMIKNKDESIRIFSFPNTISRLEIVEGYFPKYRTEIALDKRFSKYFKLGDKVELVDNKGEVPVVALKKNIYTISAFVNSPEFIDNQSIGYSKSGNGKLSGVGYVYYGDFASPVYTIGRLSYKNTVGLNQYSKKYIDTILQNKKKLQKILSNRESTRLNDIKKEAMSKIKDSKQNIENSFNKLEDSKKKLSEAQNKIKDGEKKYSVSLADFEKQKNEGRILLDRAGYEIKKNEEKLKLNEQYMLGSALELKTGKVEIDKKINDLIGENYQNRNPSSENININDLDEKKIIDIRIDADSLKYNLEKLQDLILNTNYENLAGDKNISDNTESKLKAFDRDVRVHTEYINDAGNLVDQKIKEISDAINSLKNAKIQLVEAKYALQEKNDLFDRSVKQGEEKLKNARKELDNSKRAYEKNNSDFQKNYVQAYRKIEDGKKKIEDAEARYANLKEVNYKVYARDEFISTYDVFRDGINRLDSLSNIFPVFFFAVALLVTLSTMLRMVDEQRSHIGILKALGYNKWEIMKKYIMYGFFSGLIGYILGVTLGLTLLPSVIYKSYAPNSIFSSVVLRFDYKYVFLAFIIALSCTVLSTVYILNKELKVNPSALMRKKPPKSGSKIFLERITPIWNRLSFNKKVTARNIFRYKVRMSMTILGIAGCTTLLVTGIGIRDSIKGISDLQYSKISKYELLVTFDNNALKKEVSEFKEMIYKNSMIMDSEEILYQKINTENKSDSEHTINLIVPKKVDRINDFIELRDRKTSKSIKLDNDSAVLTEKFVDSLKDHSGRKLTVYTDSGEEKKLKYGEKTEWYLQNYMYMSPKYYEKTFGKNAEFNGYLLKLQDSSAENVNIVSREIMKLSAAQSVTSTKDSKGQVDATLNGLNFSIVIMIICSSLLAYVVLFNLTNINVAERIYELSTIKVLGFYPKETSMYIFRENFVLTIFGIILGFVLGNRLQNYIITTLPPADSMFVPGIKVSNYIISAVLTMIFSIVVMMLMHKKINSTNMLDALKSSDN